VWGNGLGQSFFLEVTLSSGQVEWSASPGNHSFEVHSCEQFRRMVRFGGWCKTIISIGNGTDSHSLGKTHSLRGFIVISARGMAKLGEWSRFNNQGQAFPRADSFSLGCTMISVGGMAQLGEWSRLRNQGHYSSMLGKNSLDSPWMMFYYSEGRCSSRYHRCEWKNGPDDSVCIMILLCRLISDDMIVVETVCL
jgi:hypothetical protein